MHLSRFVHNEEVNTSHRADVLAIGSKLLGNESLCSSTVYKFLNKVIFHKNSSSAPRHRSFAVCFMQP